MIHRFIKTDVIKTLKAGYVTGIFGARRTGKTVLLRMIKNVLGDSKILLVQGDDTDVMGFLSSNSSSVLERFVSGYDYLFIDEAQKIPGIGLSLKLLADLVPKLRILFTGSSALELYQKVGEPLTGRSVFYQLHPIAQLELDEDTLQANKHLEERLVYGSYPQIITNRNVKLKIKVLTSIRNGYLLKDLLELDNQKDSLFVLNLLKLIAFQIGNDISYTELAKQLNVNTRTVQRYLYLLEKIFVLFSLHGFSRNLRKEISKSPRYYFWDNGIRNIVINRFNPLHERDDTGKLWENYIISERMKKLHYKEINVNTFFWRTYDQKEIDFIEERDGKLYGYEIKWGRIKQSKPPEAFLKTYKDASYTLINPENYLEFIA